MTDEHQSAAETSRIAAPPGSGLPVLPPLAAAIEILLLVVVPGLLDHLVPGFPSLNETQPHVFWLPVLLLSMQYGTVSGLLAAGAAIVLSSVVGWPEQDIGENHFSYLLRIWLQPVLWLATAIVLGQFRLRQIERKEALMRAVAELTDQRQAIAAHARQLRARCESLERVLATRHDPDARSLLTAVGGVQSPDPAEARAALHAAIGLAFGDCTLSIWTRDGGALKLADRYGPPSAGAQADTFSPGDALHAAVVAQGRRLSVLAPGDENELGNAGLAAAPIVGGDNVVAGMVLLERAGPGEIDEGVTLRLMAMGRIIADRMRDASVPSPAVLPRPQLVPVMDGSGRARIWRQVRWRGGSRRSRAGGRPG
ncbi:MAG: hypothetical protein SFW09_12455 [Hyphomicrobiaceae bacterium]|nr:hypothetical protein [Hyphomicrobiaceae bacterium]